MKTTLVVVCFLLTSVKSSESPDAFLQILAAVRDQFQLDLFVTVSTHSSPMSTQLLRKLHGSLSVQIIHYSNLWRPPRNINPYKHGKVVLEKVKRNFLLVAMIDEVASRGTLFDQIFGLTYRNPMAKVIFFLAENSTMRKTVLESFIRRCFDKDVIDVVFVQNQDPPKMLTYHPFNNLQIIKLTKISDFFANRFTNLKKYPLKVVTYNMPPRAMKSHEEEKIIGYAGYLIASYIEKRNASVIYIPKRDGESLYFEVMDNLVTREMDVFWGALSMTHFDIGEPSYPFLYEKFCVMVPVPKAIPVYRNFLQPFDGNVWISVICGVFYMTVVSSVVDATVNGRKDISAAFISSICFIIGRGEIGIFSNLNRRLFVIYLLLFLLGFILSNMYCALLTTFLTSPSYEREIKTLADITARGLKIVGEQVEVDYLGKREVYKEYHPLLRKLSFAENMKIRNTQNNTNPALVQTDSFVFLNEIQKYQNDIKFKLSEICPLELYLSAFFKDESILVENFNEHSLLVQQSGLLLYWKSNSFFEALRSGYLHLKRGNTETGPIKLTLIHLQISFYVLLSGLIISMSAFLAEILYYNYLIMYKKM